MTRLLLAGAVLALGLISSPLAAAASGPESAPDVSVREEGGTYLVRATFAVSQSAGVARAVLTDYEQIPRFMPEVKTSVIIQRSPRLLVEQAAVSQFGLFSKSVHLVLEVTQDDDGIRFIDRCGKSFSRYQGSWQLEQKADGTAITYELTANPAFGVPQFILKRLLKRDSGEMIDRMVAEMAARAR